MDDRSRHLAVIGAGPVGLAVARALLRHGITYEQLEADDDLGGNWYHGVYETAHIISSRKTTEYADFPMPDNYPDFPSAQQMLDYLASRIFIGESDRHGHHPLYEAIVLKAREAGIEVANQMDDLALK